jgi:hypothetical protein
MRGASNLVANCSTYEFEDIAAELTGADQVAPGRAWSGHSLPLRLYKAASRLTGSSVLPAPILLAEPRLRLERTYDLFLPILNNPHELIALKAVPNWRTRSRFAACYIDEVWLSHVRSDMIAALEPFDRIYVITLQAADRLTQLTGRPCTHLPLGVDALQFSPYPDPPPRMIAVCGIGRRSDVTHRALLDVARERGLFYYYDTARSTAVVSAARQFTFSVTNPAEHRLLYANLLKRSCYYIANRARANEPELTKGVDEISGRFFEGAAAGTVMIGEPPQNGVFGELFDWPDAVIPAPFDAPSIGEVIASLDAQPERCERIRRLGVANSLLRHDWMYRLRAILLDAGIPAPPAMRDRELRLRKLAEQIMAME